MQDSRRYEALFSFLSRPAGIAFLASSSLASRTRRTHLCVPLRFLHPQYLYIATPIHTVAIRHMHLSSLCSILFRSSPNISSTDRAPTHYPSAFHEAVLSFIFTSFSGFLSRHSWLHVVHRRFTSAFDLFRPYWFLVQIASYLHRDGAGQFQRTSIPSYLCNSRVKLLIWVMV